jgi:hypothetical protein
MVPTQAPPEGSSFTLGPEGDGRYRITWPSAESGLERWGGAAFVAFWLCGWAVGEVVGLAALARAWRAGWVALLCLDAVWLTLWTLGGLWAMRVLRGLIRGGSLERVTLGVDELHHDPGARVPPREKHEGEGIRGLFKRWPRPRTFRREQVGDSLLLDRVGERQRLSVDGAGERVEIGYLLREPEREWLHGVLRAWAGMPFAEETARPER